MMKRLMSLALIVCMLFAFATPAVKATEEIQVCGIFGDVDEVYNPNGSANNA